MRKGRKKALCPSLIFGKSFLPVPEFEARIVFRGHLSPTERAGVRRHVYLRNWQGARVELSGFRQQQARKKSGAHLRRAQPCTTANSLSYTEWRRGGVSRSTAAALAQKLLPMNLRIQRRVL